MANSRIEEFIKWFNGKKTVIGCTLLVASDIIQKLAVEIWHLDSCYTWLLPVSNTFMYIGGVFGGAGLFHKLLKNNKKK